ncbi:hypothetical protein PR202_ga18180 [Eleusine coracana subsp. coracana]|uniref:STAS domain-containing protein n=1 Tax=Eleusine coracana subsp. coracana TaxID=191504 RepID=A0AAV5CSG0_ELECO|nr:hypothetical protein PR202_ga18180 [Eleusine coracana subsp. coracana]
MVVNNKVDSLSYDVEAPPAAADAPPPPPPPAPAPVTMMMQQQRQQVVELHKVSVPEPRTTTKALRQRLAEVFFPDDPLHQFKNQSSARRLVLALHYFFPIFQWGSEYSPRLLRSDVVAGLTIASLAIPQWEWQTITMGLGFLAILLLTRQISARNPKLFWVSAGAPLASVIVSTIMSFIWKSHSIRVIGMLPRGVNPPSANMLTFSGSYVALTIKTGIMTGILSLTEGIAVGRTFASINNYQVDGNKEMMAIGIMNMAGSCASCYVTTGSFSRSAVNYSAGCKTAMSNIVMAAAVLITLLFLMPLFHYTPNVILSAIIITAVIGLIDVRGAAKLWKMGLAIAVGISLFKILLQVTRPNLVVKGIIPGTKSYRSVTQYREAVRVPGLLIVGVESAVYFANSMYLVERVMRFLRDEEEKALKANQSSIRCVVLDMSAVSAIDTSGLDALSEMKRVLDKRNIELVLANPVGSVTERMFNSAVGEAFGSDRLFFSVAEAVAASQCKAQP